MKLEWTEQALEGLHPSPFMTKMDDDTYRCIRKGSPQTI